MKFSLIKYLVARELPKMLSWPDGLEKQNLNRFYEKSFALHTKAGDRYFPLESVIFSPVRLTTTNESKQEVKLL